MPTSRIAPRERYVAKLATSAACSRPYCSVTRDDQLLADVAREVEVDVGHRHELAVEEAPEREVVRDRVDVREAGQVADERADGRAAAAAGRQHVPHRAGPAHLVRDTRARARAPPSAGGRSRRGRARRSARAPRRAAARAACAPFSRRVPLGERAARRRGAAARSPARRGRRSRDSGSRAPPSGRTAAVRASSAVRSTASRSSGKRSAHLLRREQDHSWLPRRSRSQPSSDVRQRTATSTSCSAARRGSCACTSPVATVCTFSASARSRSARVSAHVAALVRTLQLDEETVAAECAVRARRRRSGRGRARPSRAQPERQTSPSLCSPSSCGSSAGGSGSRFVL